MKSSPLTFSKDLLLTKPAVHRRLDSGRVHKEVTHFQTVEQLRSCVRRGIAISIEEQDRIEKANALKALKDLKQAYK